MLFRRVFCHLSISLVLCVSVAYGQRLNFKVYKPSDGLPQSQVLSIFQDSKGYFWFGTNSGVSRYNGVRFETFDMSSGMSSYTILCMGEDAEGLLYFGTEGGGLNVYDGARFTQIHFGSGGRKDMITDILTGADGNLWVATRDGLICRGNGIWKEYGVEDGLPSRTCYSLLQDRFGALWVGTSNGAARFDGARFISPPMEMEAGRRHVLALVEDREGGLWYAVSGGLMRLSGTEIKRVELPEGIPQFMFQCGVVDREGEIWFGTQEGVVHYADGVFNQYTTRNGLGDNQVYAVMVGREGSIWIATDNGVSKLRKGPFVHFNKDTGLVSDMLGPIFKDGRGRVWVGTNEGISVFEGDDIWTLTTEDGLTNPVVNAIAEDSDGSILIGSGANLVRWDVRGITSVFEQRGVLSLLRDSSGRIWVGGLGLSLLENGRATNLPSDNVLTKLFVDEIEEDWAGRIWFGTRTSGCFVYENGEFTVFGKEVGLDRCSVDAFAFDARRRVWIGTRGSGAFCWDGKEFQRFTTSNGLSSNFVWTILVDSDGNVWFCTNNGIDRYDGKEFRNFNSRDGLAAEEGVTNSAVEDDNKRLWFGSVEGLNLYTKKLTIVNRVPPPVYIERMSVNGGDIGFAAGLELGPDENDISFEYVGLSFRSERDVRFRHKLEGLDEDWSKETYEHSVRYASLPPGDYVFMVKACNDDGYWSETPASVRFTILPPFYQTWWFLALVLSCVALTLTLLHFWRVRKVSKEKQMLEVRVRERTRDLAAANQELEAFTYSVSHDLRGPVWRIGEFCQILSENYRDKLNSSGLGYLQRIDAATKRMHSLIEDLLKLAGSSRGTLQRESINLSSLAGAVAAEYLQMSDSRKVSVGIGDGIVADGDEHLLRVVIDNLMSNAFKFTRKREEARIAFGVMEVKGRRIYFVRDNGIGFDPGKAADLFLPFRRLHDNGMFEGNGVGLATVLRIVERHGGRVWAESVIGEGATFYFTLEGEE
jgi:ligand-binding sensor domain-containing protein/signal transduction histidine kinase